VRQRLAGEREPADEHEAPDGAGHGADDDDLEKRALHEPQAEGLVGVAEEVVHGRQPPPPGWTCDPVSSISTIPARSSTTSREPAKVRRSTSALKTSSVGP
jgi:hypothetical protein